MIHDEVNNPEHYNQQGIEVIDVIEAYELPYHLGNVIKYVLRHSYKGRPLQDLQKALWYLARYVEDLELVQEIEDAEDAAYLDDPDVVALREKIRLSVLACLEEADLDADDYVEFPDTDAYGRGLRASPPVNIDGETLEECSVCGETLDPDMSYDRSGALRCDECYRCDVEACSCNPDPVADWSVCDAIDAHESAVDSLYVHTAPERIAGSTDAAQDIKNGYYNHDPFEIRGYCANCDKEIQLSDVYVAGVPGFDPGLKFCSSSCVDKLREWQGRAK